MEKARKNIYREIIESETDAEEEATQEYPYLDSQSPHYSRAKVVDRMKRKMKFCTKLKEEQRVEVAAKYELTQEQLDEICREGKLKYWTIPTN